MLKNGTFTYTEKDIKKALGYLDGTRSSQMRAIKSLSLAIGDSLMAYRVELLAQIIESYKFERLSYTLEPNLIKLCNAYRRDFLIELEKLLDTHYSPEAGFQLYLRTKEGLQQEEENQEAA